MLTDCVNPDGTYTDEDRARRRGLTLGKQGPDGISAAARLADPRSPRHVRGRAGQNRHPRPVQPRRRPARGRRPSRSGCGTARHPLGQPAQPRRTQRGAAGATRVGNTGPTQRVTGHHHRDHHAARPRGRHRHRTDPRGHPPDPQRCHPHGPPRPPLPGPLRQRPRHRAVSHQTTGLTRPAHRPLRQ